MIRQLQRLVLSAALCGLACVQGLQAQTINICYVKSPFNLQNIVMKERGLLEREFAKDAIAVRWHDINSGAKQTQAMASGALDISAVMNTTSLLLSAAAGNDIAVATGVAHPGNVFALVGKTGPRLSVRSLKGKRVAGPRGTVLHQMLIAALKREGMTIRDVDFVSMDPPKAYAALVSGSVDAALLAAGLILKANAAGMETIATAKGLVNPNLVLVVRRAFAKDHPELLGRIIRVHREALAWIRSHEDEALALGAKAQGVDLASARKLYAWSGFYDVLTEGDIQGLEADQRFLLDNKLMRKGLDVRKLVLPSAMR